MTEHIWTQENIPGYLAGGLDPAERERLEQHVALCANCCRELEEARETDRRLEALFAPVRPDADLEDRLLQPLRVLPYRRGFRPFSRWGKALVAAAAILLLVTIGAGASNFLQKGFRTQAANQLKSPAQMIPPSPRQHLRKGIPTHDEHVEGGAAMMKGGTEARGGDGNFEPPAAMMKGKAAARGETGVDWGEATEQTLRDPDRLAQEMRNRIIYNPEGLKAISGLMPSGSVDPQQPMPDSTIANQGLTARVTGQGQGSYFKPAQVLKEKTKSKEEEDEEENEKHSSKQAGKEKQSAQAQPTKKLVEGRDAEAGQSPPPPTGRKIIRSGDLDFEVESFDDSVAIIMELVRATKGGFVATINSDKLANGKVCGSVVVRVPPENLDKLVLDLRKDLGKKGELKGQRIGSQDITKQFTDMESRLRAARTMEERLLKIIKDGKGEIKDLVAAEKELGVWRTKIEELEGELRYYGNLVSLSTLTVNLAEKEIRLAAAVAERERVQTGIEVEDVEKAYQDALKAIAQLKGRVTRSELKQHAAGQFNALLHFEVAPESAGLMRDRLRQLGAMVRLEIDTVRHAEGSGKMPLTGKVNRGDTQFIISIYNLANVQPRETVTLKIAAVDVAVAQQKLREAVADAKGRLVNASLNEQDRQNITAQLDFDVRRSSQGAVQTALADAGEQLSRQVGRVPEGDNITDAKVLYKLELVPASAIPPREITKLALELSDVPLTLRAFNDDVKEAKGRAIQPPALVQERNGRVTARVVFDVPLPAGSSLVDQFKSAGQVRVHEVTPNPQAPDGKLALARIEVVLSNGQLLVPRDEGIWSQVQSGLSLSLRGLSYSASWLIVGLLFVLPWLVLLYVVVWVARRLLRRGGEVPAVTSAPAAGSASGA